MAESFNSRKGKVEAALDAKKVSYLKEIQKTDASIVELSADHLRTLRDTDKEYAKNIAKLKEINAEQQKFKQGNVDAERGLKSLTGIYTNLGGMERERLTMQNSLSSVNEKHIGHFNNIASLNQDLAKLSADDVIQRQLILDKIAAEKAGISNVSAEEQKILDNLDTQTEQSKGLSSLTEAQRDQLDSQVKAYETIKKSIGGVLATASLLFSGWRGFARISLLGAGKAMTELGKSTRELGGFLGGAQISGTALSFVFKDALDVTKGLAEELGGVENATFAAQLNTNLMATNMGISGAQAAKLTGSFARLNGGSVETAQNLANGAKEMAKTAGVVPSKVMADLADSAEAFALYGKDGGKNLAQAAVQAAKMGVSLKTMTGIADNLLDFENSINQEMELGAMLGKNLNLDRARALAYEGDIAGATQETLNALGGVDEFNKMDYFQKKKTAELLGTSVEELQKMVTTQEEAATIGGQINGAFNTATESLTALTTGPLGGLVSGLSGAIGTAKEMTSNFKDAGGALKSMGGFLKSKFGGAAPTTPAAAPIPPAGVKPPQTQAGPTDQANKFSKINTTDLIKGAAALLILAAALWVSAKAFQEFATVKWEDVGKGLVGLVGLAGIAYILSKASGSMIQGAVAIAILGAALVPFAFAMSLIQGLSIDSVLAAAAGLVMFGLAAAGIGVILPLILAGSLGIAALGAAMILFGAGLTGVSAGMGAISAVIPLVTEQISALSQINFMPILGLAGALTILSIALAAVAATGLLALPALMALGLVAGGAAAVFGGGEEGGDKDAKMDELIGEIKALRADMAAGKIAVHMDGAKVTAGVSKVVDRIGSNSYAKV
jgi:hypothetical protein